MLDKLEKIFIDNGYHIVKYVKDLDDCPCKQSMVKAIHFDDVAVKFFKKYVINDFLKSNDLLFLMPKKNEIHFVEMKRAEGIDCADFWGKYYHSEGIKNKNIHSIFVLISIASTYNIDRDFYAYFFDNTYPNKVRIRTSIVCNLPSHQMPFMFYLTAGGSGINFHENLRGEVDIIDCNTFEKYFLNTY